MKWSNILHGCESLYGNNGPKPFDWELRNPRFRRKNTTLIQIPFLLPIAGFIIFMSFKTVCFRWNPSFSERTFHSEYSTSFKTELSVHDSQKTVKSAVNSATGDYEYEDEYEYTEREGSGDPRQVLTETSHR